MVLENTQHIRASMRTASMLYSRCMVMQMRRKDAMHTTAFASDGSSLMSSSRRLTSPVRNTSHTVLMSFLYSREGEGCRWDNLHTLSPIHRPLCLLHTEQNERESQLCVMHRCLLESLMHNHTGAYLSRSDKKQKPSIRREGKQSEVDTTEMGEWWGENDKMHSHNKMTLAK